MAPTPHPVREAHDRSPRPVLDAGDRLVGHVLYTECGADGRAREILVDLTPAACDTLLGPGRREGVFAVPADLVVAFPDAVRLVRHMSALKDAWKQAPAQA